MESDSLFRMGATHSICQDYAIAGERGLRRYAVISDGCSGEPIPGEPGSPYTDFGSRFIVRAAQERLEDLAQGHFDGYKIISVANAIAYQARLPKVALDATLIALVGEKDRPAIAYQMGDGVIACKDRDGTIRYESLSFGNGMPLYLSYLIDRPRMSQLLSPKGSHVTPAMIEEAGTVTSTRGTFRPGRGWEAPLVTKERFTEDSITERRTLFHPAQTEVVLIMSDGAESFQLKDKTSVPLESVLLELFDFKGFMGQFIVRRCNRFLGKVCAERGWQHSDDLSVAGLYLGAVE